MNVNLEQHFNKIVSLRKEGKENSLKITQQYQLIFANAPSQHENIFGQ